MKISRFVVSAMLCISIYGCSDDKGLPVDIPGAQSSISGSGGGTLSDFLLGHHSVVTSSGTRSSQSVNIDLYHPDSTHSVSGGAITINGIAVPKWNQNGGTWYQNRGNTWSSPLVLDGSFHVFNVPGDPGFPALTDSIQSPSGATTISYPTPADTLSRSTGATIQWTPTGGVDGVRVTISDTSISVGSKRSLIKNISGNSGSVSFSPTELSQLDPGPILVRVNCGNIKSDTVGAGQRYRITVFSSQTVKTWLKN